MRGWTLVIMLALALVVQTLAGLSAALSSVVDPFLVVAVLAAMRGHRARALTAGFLSGVIEDAWASRWYGQFAFTHLVITFLIARVGVFVDLFQPLPVTITFAIATAADWGLQLGLAAAFDRPLAQTPGLWGWFEAMGANVVLGWIFLRVMRRLEAGER